MECTWLKTNNKEYDKGHVFGLPSNEDYYQNGGLDVLIEEVLQNMHLLGRIILWKKSVKAGSKRERSKKRLNTTPTI